MTLGPVGADDVAAIRQVLDRWAQAIDNAAWHELDQVFTPDVAFDAAGYWVHGIDGVVGHVQKVRHAGMMNPHHAMADLLLGTLPDGRVRAWHSFLVVRGNGHVASGEYLDTLVRTADDWRVSVRRAERGNRPDTDPGGGSTRAFDFVHWETDERPHPEAVA